MVKHPNIVKLLEIIPNNKRVLLVFEFVDSNLYEVIEKNPLGLEILFAKRIIFQLLKGLQYCHSLNIIHRDIKPENILISNFQCLKLCDFGFARKLSNCNLTDYVSTRWYRSPELLVKAKYGFASDTWAVGCVIFEMITGQPLFPGENDYDTLCKIVQTCGNLPKSLIKAYKASNYFTGLEVMNKQVPKCIFKEVDMRLNILKGNSLEIVKNCLELSPNKRLTIEELLNHSFFDSSKPDKDGKSGYASKVMKKLNLSNISPDQKTYKELYERKKSPKLVLPLKYSESQLRLKKNEISELSPLREKLPTIRSKKIKIYREQKLSDYLQIDDKLKSVSKKKNMPSDDIKRNNSILSQKSNESLPKISFDGQFLSYRSVNTIKEKLESKPFNKLQKEFRFVRNVKRVELG